MLGGRAGHRARRGRLRPARAQAVARGAGRARPRGAVAEESLAGIRTVRAFAPSRARPRATATPSSSSFELAKSAPSITGVFMGVAMLGRARRDRARALVRRAARARAARMTVGELTSFLVYTLVVAFSLGALGDLWADFMQARGRRRAHLRAHRSRPRASRAAGGAEPRARRGSHRARGTWSSRTRRAATRSSSRTSISRRARRGRRPGRPVGRGQVARIAALLSRLYDPTRGAVLPRRPRSARARPELAAPPDRRGRAGAHALLEQHRREHPLRPRHAPPTPRSRPPRAPPTRTTSSRASRRATRRSSASAACSSPAARSSAWPSRAPCSRTRAS